MDKVYLDTSHGMSEYAKRFGAKFDFIARAWYCLSPVPPALLNLVPKPANPSSRPMPLTDHIAALFDDDPGGPTGRNEPLSLPREWPVIQDLVAAAFSDPKRVLVWFSTPKIALRGKTPIQVIRTSAGCSAVIQLLSTLND